MATNVARWGNSLAIRLPKTIAEQAGLREGESLEVKVSEAGDVVLSRTRRRYTLDELVSKITPENRQKLINDCNKYLTDHPGTVYFSVGTQVDDLARPVNDREFDVALHVVFKTRADHDRYQTAERHIQFINENKPTWKRVRVFDSYLK